MMKASEDGAANRKLTNGIERDEDLELTSITTCMSLTKTEATMSHTALFTGVVCQCWLSTFKRGTLSRVRTCGL